MRDCWLDGLTDVWFDGVRLGWFGGLRAVALIVWQMIGIMVAGMVALIV